MIKGCGMGLVWLLLPILMVFPPSVQTDVINEDMIRHNTLEMYCNMMVKQRIYKTFDLEKTCTMNVAFFKDRVREKASFLVRQKLFVSRISLSFMKRLSEKTNISL